MINMAAEKGMGKFNARTVVDGVRLGAWATCRRIDYRERRIEARLKEELEKVPGWQWTLQRRNGSAIVETPQHVRREEPQTEPEPTGVHSAA